MSRKPDNGPDSRPDPFRPNDPGDMLARIREFPRQVEDAWEIVSGLDIQRKLARDVRQVLVAGMGGSAIGADLVSGLVADQCPLPIHVHRSYGVPAWVDRHTLFIASSYSGNTEETLDAWEAAGAAGGRRVAISTGGELAERAEKAGAPLIRFEYEAQPRAALGYSFTLLYGLLARWKLIDVNGSDLERAAEALRAAGPGWEPDTELSTNRAKQLAQENFNCVPVILGAGHLAPVARRWVTQINENAKAWAAWDELPELNHNSVVGLRHPGGTAPLPDLLRVTVLASARYHERVSRRLEVTGEFLDRAGIRWSAVTAPDGAGPLGELLWCAWLGDFLSYYLACLYQEDPTPVEAIAYLKQKLKDR